MKTTKTLLALFLALALFCSLAVSAYADEPANLDGHTFKLYQIFSGTQAPATSPKLADIAWGNGVDSAALLAALSTTAPFNTAITTSSTAADVAKFLSTYPDNYEDAKSVPVVFSKLAYAAKTNSIATYIVGATDNTIDLDTDLQNGYYLVVDESTAAQQNVDNFVFNMQLLQLTEKDDFEIRVKAEYPTVEKKVKDKDDTAGTTSEWQDSADYDIGDAVPFQLTVKLPDMSRYDTYAIEITDTLSAGLTAPDPTSIRVYTTKNGSTPIASSNVERAVSGQVITVRCDNIKQFANNGDTVTVEFEAVLNSGAVVGSAGNANEVQLRYSNNPNDNQSFGRTPKDLVRVFTYKVIVNKVDEAQKPLTGADFELYKKDAAGNWALVTDNGTAPNKPTKTTSDKILDPTSPNPTTVPGCVFTFTGLDDGDYKLVETTTPRGYNHIEDIYFSVIAGHTTPSEDPQLTSLIGGNVSTGEISFASDLTAGSLETTVINKAGVILPETGDEGVTMLYVFGSALLLGALVLIVTKKRVGEQA